MSYRYSNRSKQNMEGLHPQFKNFLDKLIKISKYDFVITCGIRSDKEQNKLYQKGRSLPGKIITNCDGYKYKSNHQIKSDGYGYAADIAILINNKIDWDIHLFKELVDDKVRNLMDEYNIEWGGDWSSFKDYPHFQKRS